MDIQAKRRGRPRKSEKVCNCNSNCKKDKNISVKSAKADNFTINEVVEDFATFIESKFGERPEVGVGAIRPEDIERLKELNKQTEQKAKENEALMSAKKVIRAIEAVTALTDDEFVKFLEVFEHELFERSGIPPFINAEDIDEMTEETSDDSSEEDEDDYDYDIRIKVATAEDAEDLVAEIEELIKNF